MKHDRDVEEPVVTRVDSAGWTTTRFSGATTTRSRSITRSGGAGERQNRNACQQGESHGQPPWFCPRGTSGVPEGNRAPRHEVPAAYWALLGRLIVRVSDEFRSIKHDLDPKTGSHFSGSCK